MTDVSRKDDKSERNLLSIDWNASELPTLPKVANRLLRILNNEDALVKDLADCIDKDPALATKVLRAANSAFYAMRFEVTSIHQAIVLLGFREIGRIALSSLLADRLLSVAPIAKHHAVSMWKHMTAVAVLAKDLTPRDVMEPDAYTLGLLHDIGWLILVSQAPNVFVSMCEEPGLNTTEMERLWATDHCLWGAKLAEKWNLPEPFQIVSLRHHDPFQEVEPPKYLLRIALADYAAKTLGISMLNTEQNELDDRILKALSFSEAWLNDWLTTLRGSMGRFDAVWSAFS
ncbi:MAG: HDOD domain-containing protein [Dissulfuribacterales bacterium]